MALPYRPKGRSPGRELDDRRPRSDGGLFVWTIIILLLIGFAFGCWIFSFYVFGHPEKAFSYKILSKLKKIEPLKRFEPTTAPRGEFLTAAALSERYGKMTNRELERASEELLRSYIRNYKLSQDRVPYVVGTYTILAAQELTDKEMFPSGVVALTQSKEVPGLLVEHIYPGDKRDVPVQMQMMITGVDLRLNKSDDFSAVIEVKRLPDGRLLFTVAPLLYGSYTSTNMAGTFSAEPPAALNIEAGLPILDTDQIEAATQKYATHKARSAPGAAATASAQLMKVARPQLADPDATPIPAPDNTLPVKRALPVAKAEPVNPTPSPTPSPAALPSPSPGTVVASSGGEWPTFAPGQMPRGRLVDMSDTDNLALQGVGGDTIYLRGDFVVMATSESRAVMRQVQPGTNTPTGDARVVVEFPAGSNLPAQGQVISRDASRAFRIVDVRRSIDGRVNVTAREITKAP